MKIPRHFSVPALALILTGAMTLTVSKPASALPVTISGFTGYGYNTINAAGNGYDGLPGAIGCGPTTAAMILNYYTSTGPAPGLISDPLADARAMTAPGYMDVNASGFGPAVNYQFGVEKFAHDRGYIVDAVIHAEPTDPPAAWASYTGWAGYSVGSAVAFDAAFWNTADWTINNTAFLNFLATEIDAGRPVSMTVDSDGNGGTDHWMAGVGYDRATNQWAGYDTWDTTLHWYDIQSAFHAGNTMGVGYVRTFSFLGPEVTAVPEPSTILLLGSGLLGLGYFGRKRIKG